MFLSDIEKFELDQLPLIAGYDDKNKLVIYEKATEVIVKQRKTQQMIELNSTFENDDVSFVVTPTHDLYYGKQGDYRKYKAKTLLENHTGITNFLSINKEFDLLITEEDVKTIEYTGRTWCVSVPHTFIITRRAQVNSDNIVVKVSAPVIMGNCMIGHGTTQFLNERLFECSDKYTVTICEKCGNFATSNTTCRACETDQVVDIKLPYVSKLVLQELNAMLIKTKMAAKS